METQTAKPVIQILGTLALSVGQPTTQPPSPACNASEKQQKRREWLDKWLRLRITHLQLSQAENEIYELCRRYSKTPARGCTVVIFGENGCGKSHIVKRLAFWANRVSMKLPLVEAEHGVGTASAVYANWPEVVDGFKRDQWDVVDDLQHSNMLVIDDIGAEHDPSRIGVEKLYVILNRREHRWNIITTNVLPGAWDEKFERRIASRLFRNAQHIDLSKVPDYSTT